MTGASWTLVRVGNLTDRAGVLAALFSSGAEAVQELDHELVTQLRSPDANALRGSIAARDPGASVELESAPDVDWSSAWRSRIGAHEVGRLTVCPPWLADGRDPRNTVVIEPAMAFGTGEHETTRGVMRLLSRHLRAGDMVIDVGAGSAVLAIAAVKLGASRAAAIEVDPDATDNAEANIAANGVADSVSFITGDANDLLPLLGSCDLLVANILSSVILEIEPAFAESIGPEGRAIFSGVMASEDEEFRARMAARGWHVGEVDAEGEWRSYLMTRE